MMTAKVINATGHWGALPSDWDHLTFILGLTEDLLPVVSNPEAAISPTSKLASKGKVPSLYNGQRQVVGLAKWTQKLTTEGEIRKWRPIDDYGICIQTRQVRAIDVDVTDEALARKIKARIAEYLGGVILPCRTRGNASKFLLVFEMPGEFPKRIIKTEHGNIEFLGSGQQFIAVGTHPSGVRYVWEAGLPNEIPPLEAAQFEALWAWLAFDFGHGESLTMGAGRKGQGTGVIPAEDPIGDYLDENGWTMADGREGERHIRCPFEDGHSMGQAGDGSTTYFPPDAEYQQGHFKCLHGSCSGRTRGDFLTAIGYQQDVFADLVGAAEAEDVEQASKPSKYQVVSAGDFSRGARPGWIVKGVIPRAELVVLFGESGSGKSFFALDLALAVVRGEDWRGHRVTKGRVVYIAAEGGGGFRNRLAAYQQHHGINLDDYDLGIIHAAPNFLDVADAAEVAKAVRVAGKADIIIADTWAQVTAGANENSGEDMGKALGHCKLIHKATGAVVLLVHHAGKDTSKGARGWSGLRAAADAEIEVMRTPGGRVARISKQKDGDDGLAWGFDLQTIPIGMDEDGDVIDSCIVIEKEAQAVKPVKAPRGDNEKLVLQVFNCQILPKALDYEELKLQAIAMLPFDPEQKKRDRREQAVGRAIESLIKSGHLWADDDLIGLAGVTPMPGNAKPMPARKPEGRPLGEVMDIIADNVRHAASAFISHFDLESIAHKHGMDPVQLAEHCNLHIAKGDVYFTLKE